MNIKIISTELVGKLPPLMELADGTPITEKSQWEKKRAEMFEKAVGLQFGGMPDEPEFFEISDLKAENDGSESFVIKAGTNEKQVSFDVRVWLPEGIAKPAVIISGDGANEETIALIKSRGAAFAVFNKTALAPDHIGPRESGLYDVYPGTKFSGLSAWAWGYHRTTDALIKMGLVDPEKIVYTGHSRGGKTALLAGVTDSRAKIVNPCGSGCGGVGLYHIHFNACTEDGDERRNEQLKDILTNFPYWFSEDMLEYIDRDYDLPFDQHWMTALVAPRFMVVNEGLSDIWASPYGTYLSVQEAKKAYKFLGAENNIIAKWRKGGHSHSLEDYTSLLDVMDHAFNGKDLPENANEAPEEFYK